MTYVVFVLVKRCCFGKTKVHWKMQTEKHEGFYVTYVFLVKSCCCCIVFSGGTKDEDELMFSFLCWQVGGVFFVWFVLDQVCQERCR